MFIGNCNYVIICCRFKRVSFNSFQFNLTEVCAHSREDVLKKTIFKNASNFSTLKITVGAKHDERNCQQWSCSQSNCTGASYFLPPCQRRYRYVTRGKSQLYEFA